MRSFTPRLDILPKAQREIWPCLAPAKDLGMVLYGGTAIALRFGHRQSIDFDFFTHTPLDKTSLLNSCTILSPSTTLQDDINTLSVNVKSNNGHVMFSFFGDIRTGRIEDPALSDDGVILAASTIDLLAHKLKVILERPLAKDYIDICALLQSGLSLARGLAAARKMWPGYQPAVGLKALSFFEDGDLSSLTENKRRYLAQKASQVRDLPDIDVKPSLLP